jgi:nucleoside-diphosphate-sugar epimerase
MQKKITVIGASSFLAQSYIDFLRQKKIAVSLTLLSRNKIAKYADLDFVAYDICQGKPSDISSYLLESDVIYYCAAAGVQPKHQDTIEQIFEVNAFEPIRLVNFLTTHNFQGQLISFGSYFEIGENQQEILLDETDFCKVNNNLPNAYCQSKSLFTNFAYRKITHENNLTWAHYILTNIYGKGENNERLIPYIIRDAQGGEKLKFSAGVQKRQYTNIQDIAAFLVDNLDNKIQGIYHLTNNEIMTVREVIEIVRLVLKTEKNLEFDAEFGTVSKRDLTMGFLGIDATKAMTKLGWQPQISLAEGIAQYLLN